MKILIRFGAVIGGLYLASAYVQGISVSSLYVAAIVAVILGILNLVVRPVLVALTLPVTILTLGLFLFVLNAGIFWFVGTFIKGFTVAGFVPALLGSLIVSTTSWLAHRLT